jgi:acylphosphatase
VIRRRVVVAGRVQGVWFRETCRRQAERGGLAGWVRNLGDGRVEAVFEGEPDAVERLVGWCRQGPSRAHVQRVEVRDEPLAGDRGFRVL